MFALRSLFATRQPTRIFALLDERGLCRAFHQAPQPPRAAGWVEVNEQRLSWLNQPLPAGARILPVVAHSALGKALAA